VIVEVVDSTECKELLRLFIRQYPAVWQEDIGR
jgi:hypothetical protein